MSRLSDLYKAMETLRKEGLSLNEDLEKQVSDLEENIIKKEILPIVTETIAPALKQVQRELVLVVDYVPGIPISVHLSRKRNFTADITDAKEILPDPQVEHKEIGKTGPKGKISAATRLKITLPMCRPAMPQHCGAREPHMRSANPRCGVFSTSRRIR